MTQHATPPAPRAYGALNWIGLQTLYQREVRRFWKVAVQTIFGPVVSTWLLMVVFVMDDERDPVCGLFGPRPDHVVDHSKCVCQFFVLFDCRKGPRHDGGLFDAALVGGRTHRRIYRWRDNARPVGGLSHGRVDHDLCQCDAETYRLDALFRLDRSDHVWCLWRLGRYLGR